MKYGIGNDEYNYYKTEDNGKTWSLLMEGNGDIVTFPSGRIIIYGKNNDGLKYTDDNFVTIDNSNINDGSWNALPCDKIQEVYATSSDGKGIYKSKDEGETWERISAGTGTIIEVEEIPDKPPKIIIYGNDDVVTIENGKAIYTPNATYKNKTIVQLLIEGKTVGDTLLYILNEIIISGCCSMLTGFSQIKDLEKLSNNEEVYGTYYTDGDLYKTSFKGIDFAMDVGMKPLRKEDLKEVREYKKEIDDFVVTYTDDNREIKLLELLKDSNSPLSKTFSILDMLIKTYHDYIIRVAIEDVKAKDEDYEGFETQDEKEAMKMFYDINKGSEASIIGTIINSVFTFSYSKKMALLKSSIMETAMVMKDGIKLDLENAKEIIDSGNHTKEELENNDYLNGLFKFKIKDNWKIAINNCLQDYYRSVANNLENVSKNDDKEFISAAADNYNEIRKDLIDNATKILNDINNVSEGDKIKEADDLRNSAFKNYYNNLKDLILNFRAGMITSEEFNNSADELLENYKDAEDAISEKEKIYYNAFCSAIISTFSLNIKNQINEENCKNEFFNSDFIEDYQATYNDDNINKIFDYYNQIMIEFKKRCCTLLTIICNQLQEIQLKEVKLYSKLEDYNKILKASGKSVEFFDKNNLDYLKEEDPENESKFPEAIRKSWLNMRDKL